MNRTISVIDAANEAIQRLKVTLEKEREEKAELLRKLAAVEQKPVVIPLEVAKAIEYFRYCSFSNADFVRMLFTPTHPEENKNTQVIKKFIYDESHGDVLMEALVNGYTVETLERKIELGVQKLCAEWCDEPGDFEGTELSKRIADYVSQIIREDQAATQQQ